MDALNAVITKSLLEANVAKTKAETAKTIEQTKEIVHNIAQKWESLKQSSGDTAIKLAGLKLQEMQMYIEKELKETQMNVQMQQNIGQGLNEFFGINKSIS